MQYLVYNVIFVGFVVKLKLAYEMWRLLSALT